MAKYATTEELLSCVCGTNFAIREGWPIRIQTHSYKDEEGVCCPRCQKCWWVFSKLRKEGYNVG